MSRIDVSRWIPVGLVGTPKGLRGALRLRPHNVAIASLRAGVAVRVSREGLGTRSFEVASFVRDGSGWTLNLATVVDRTGAEALVGAEVAVRRGDLPPLGEGEYYHCDVPGCVVYDAAGERVGEVLRVIAYPSVDALLVRTADGEVEVPVTEVHVASLDVAAGVVRLADGAAAE